MQGRRGPLFRELKVRHCCKIRIIGWPQVRKMMNCSKTVRLDFFFSFYSCKVGWAGILFDRTALLHIYTLKSCQCNRLLLPAHLIIYRWQMSSFTKVINNEVPCSRVHCWWLLKDGRKHHSFISHHDLTYCHVIRDILAAVCISNSCCT